MQFQPTVHPSYRDGEQIGVESESPLFDILLNFFGRLQFVHEVEHRSAPSVGADASVNRNVLKEEKVRPVVTGCLLGSFT